MYKGLDQTKSNFVICVVLYFFCVGVKKLEVRSIVTKYNFNAKKGETERIILFETITVSIISHTLTKKKEIRYPLICFETSIMLCVLFAFVLVNISSTKNWHKYQAIYMNMEGERAYFNI